MKQLKLSKEDKLAITESLEKQDFETFISYFQDSDILEECDYISFRFKEKLAPSENAEFQVNRKFYYAKITQIIKISLLTEQAGFIKGQIYYRIKDFEDCINEFPKLKECTSKDLFLTEQTKWFLSTTFQQKIQVNPIEFYSDDTRILKNNQYYTRAQYNTLKQQFKPPINQWTTYCFCSKLYDPIEPYIQCDQCNEWVHYVCSGKSDKELKNISKLKFICFPCLDANKKKKSHNEFSQIQDQESTKARSYSINNGKRKK
ncbi:unnamed protein product [Paramecium sonneborni]|uniref:PHD-type domain-containing protein n=1 Tax=Paramecium sonneborni TaxID=65129 RepID=A0A8S1RB71_9CILI|nr:unnamed protein product [Paramecium sonneborni]